MNERNKTGRHWMIKTTNADASLFHSLKVCLVKWLDLLHKQKWKARIGSNRSRLERCSSLLPNLITREIKLSNKKAFCLLFCTDRGLFISPSSGGWWGRASRVTKTNKI